MPQANTRKPDAENAVHPGLLISCIPTNKMLCLPQNAVGSPVAVGPAHGQSTTRIVGCYPTKLTLLSFPDGTRCASNQPTHLPALPSLLSSPLFFLFFSDCSAGLRVNVRVNPMLAFSIEVSSGPGAAWLASSGPFPPPSLMLIHTICDHHATLCVLSAVALPRCPNRGILVENHRHLSSVG